MREARKLRAVVRADQHHAGLPAGWSRRRPGRLRPVDSDSRFMSSGGIDNSGDIALAYSVSSLSTDPSLRYTGRAHG